MFSVFLSLVVLANPLRVCADPANLPYSDRAGEGFDNRIAGLIARDLHRPLEFVWVTETRNYVRKTLQASRCDVLLGVPAGLPEVLVTPPYYSSAYVFVGRDARPAGFDDPALARLRIGMQIAGDDYTPPAAALARRGLSANLHGYPVNGAALFDALGRREIDTAVVWGPLAGYTLRHRHLAYTLTPTVMRFRIAAAVRKDNPKLRSAVADALRHQAEAIGATLKEYGVPAL